MLMSWKHTEHTVKRQPNTRLRAAGCGLSLSLSPTNSFGDRLGIETFTVDSQYIRQ